MSSPLIRKFGSDEYVLMYKDFPENPNDKKFIGTVLRKPRPTDPGLMVVDVEGFETFSALQRWWRKWTPPKELEND